MNKILIITNCNRDDAKLWFEHEHDNVYSIHSTKDYVLEYVCVNYDSLPADSTEYDTCYTDQFGNEHKCKNHSFDPAGGPYMSIGSEVVPGYVLKRIFNENKKSCFELEKI